MQAEERLERGRTVRQDVQCVNPSCLEIGSSATSYLCQSCYRSQVLYLHFNHSPSLSIIGVESDGTAGCPVGLSFMSRYLVLNHVLPLPMEWTVRLSFFLSYSFSFSHLSESGPSGRPLYQSFMSRHWFLSPLLHLLILLPHSGSFSFSIYLNLPPSLSLMRAVPDSTA